MIFIVILADTRLKISLDLVNYIGRCRILFSIDWWQIQQELWEILREQPCKTLDFHGNPWRYSLENLRWPLNYTNRRRIWCSIDWSQIQEELWDKNSTSITIISKVNPDSQANVFKDFYENHGFYMVFALKCSIFVSQPFLNLSPIDRASNSTSIGVIYKVNPDNKTNVFKKYSNPLLTFPNVELGD